MIYFVFVTLIIGLSFFVQEFIPFIEWAYYSCLLLVHTVYYCTAVSVPFPVMLLLALFTGFLWDARYYVPISVTNEAAGAQSGQLELPFGFTIFIFGLMGAFIQGVRPLFRRGRWELPVFLIGLCVSLGLLLEYFLISFQRGGLEFSMELWWKILMTGIFTTLVSPFLLLLFSRVAKRVGYKIQISGSNRKYTYNGNAF